MKRFQHWDPEVAVLEGLPAESLFATIMAAGQDCAGWLSLVDEKEELQTWGVAETWGTTYHPDSVADLKASAYAIAATAEPPGANLLGSRLKRLAAAVTALEKGSGDEAVAREVWSLLSQIIR